MKFYVCILKYMYIKKQKKIDFLKILTVSNTLCQQPYMCRWRRGPLN